MNPYEIEGPACISFSGGRTSAYMLFQILEAHGGQLPEDVHVLFANTGKERLETLDFVKECGERWGVRIRWIEYRNFVPFERSLAFRERWIAEQSYAAALGGAGPIVRFSLCEDAGPRFEKASLCHTFREVDHATASRAGEPFEAMIRARRYLPNPVQRICTQELKIRPMRDFAQHLLGFEHWTNVIGLRADEPRRVAKTTAPNREPWDNACPLAQAGATNADVLAFWAAQPFDLRLRSHEGNCDLCFLKGRSKIERIMRARPDLATWWIERETSGLGAPGDATFRKDRPTYAKMLAGVRRMPLLPGMGLEEDDDALPCACTD